MFMFSVVYCAQINLQRNVAAARLMFNNFLLLFLFQTNCKRVFIVLTLTELKATFSHILNALFERIKRLDNYKSFKALK